MDTLTLNNPSASNENVPTSNEGDSVFDILNEIEETPQPFRSEVDAYLEEPAVEETVTPLCYWKTNEARFPNLSRLAKRYLAVPASSGGIERIFSISGAIARSRRAKISISSMSDLLLIRQEKDKELKSRLARK